MAKAVQLTPKKNQPMARLRFIRLISRLVIAYIFPSTIVD
jgi:hypothetical protein